MRALCCTNMPNPELPLPVRKHLLDAGVSTEAPFTRRVFTNRDLAFDSMKAVGFDMDYTLGIYNQPALEALSIEIGVEKLIRRGYPTRLETIQADPEFAVRGLVVDKEYGNILKMDRHGYVGRAYHGRKLLPRPERKDIYRAQRVGQERERFARVDTLFALPEVTLFAALVEMVEDHPDDWSRTPPSYTQIWTDVREAIDESHRDETIKSRIKDQPAAYFHKDPDLAPTLHKLRSAGKKLFLLTNSYYAYTQVVMGHLLNDQMAIYDDWSRYFDWVVVGSQKPSFFVANRPFLEVDRRTQAHVGKPRDEPQKGKVYEAGNREGLERALGVHSDEILYVGDHIYGDIVTSKKTASWRTVLVVEDLEQELEVQRAHELSLREIEALAEIRNEITEQLFAEKHKLRVLERLGGEVADEDGAGEETVQAAARGTLGDVRARLDRLQQHRDELEAVLQRRTATVDQAYNRYWGSIFAERLNTSLYGAQVEGYACLYTSRVSNFLYVSPSRYFHAPAARMPHRGRA
ncbi:MAG: HAD-IG family 5'-nucleotidase [Myxococcales bacterium FL481]|nr:MAG: HAD-IG family 5'-nucleotidase [Myxococcales bacterium FL481]